MIIRPVNPAPCQWWPDWCQHKHHDPEFNSWGWLDHAAPELKGKFEVFAGDIRAGDDAGNTLRVRSFFGMHREQLCVRMGRVNALTIQHIRQTDIRAVLRAARYLGARINSFERFPDRLGFHHVRSLLHDFAPESAIARQRLPFRRQAKSIARGIICGSSKCPAVAIQVLSTHRFYFRKFIVTNYIDSVYYGSINFIRSIFARITLDFTDIIA